MAGPCRAKEGVVAQVFFDGERSEAARQLQDFYRAALQALSLTPACADAEHRFACSRGPCFKLPRRMRDPVDLVERVGEEGYAGVARR